MSARKDKNLGSNGLTPASALLNRNPNLTGRPSSCRSRLNMTTCVVVAAPSVDWGLQCDLAYGNYLQALMTRQLKTHTIKQHTIFINDQLSLQTDLLEKQITRKHALEEEIEKLELKPKLQNLFEILHTLLNLVRKNVNLEMESRVNNMIQVTENACDNLYLKQVEPLKNPKDCEVFEKLLENCLKNLQKVTNICGDIDLAQQLADCLSTFKRLCSEIAKVQNSVVNLEGQVQSNTLSYLSEKLAAYRGYE